MILSNDLYIQNSHKVLEKWLDKYDYMKEGLNKNKVIVAALKKYYTITLHLFIEKTIWQFLNLFLSYRLSIPFLHFL